tara:strand:+ start:1730 stop:2014 length:285 start_codon:yes stop_codon:yes gene_type:complete
MKLFKLNKDSWKHAHWWEKKKKDWAIQDKDGTWWIIPGSEMAETRLTKDKKMKIPASKRKQSSMLITPERMVLIILSCALGISLALNVIYYLLK